MEKYPLLFSKISHVLLINPYKSVCQADVLVNGISSSLDLTQGQVAKKFLQKAGQQMQQVTYMYFGVI